MHVYHIRLSPFRATAGSSLNAVNSDTHMECQQFESFNLRYHQRVNLWVLLDHFLRVTFVAHVDRSQRVHSQCALETAVVREVPVQSTTGTMSCSISMVRTPVRLQEFPYVRKTYHSENKDGIVRNILKDVEYKGAAPVRTWFGSRYQERTFLSFGMVRPLQVELRPHLANQPSLWSTASSTEPGRPHGGNAIQTPHGGRGFCGSRYAVCLAGA
ncbi:hypothetical protein BD413DRAFT_220572 [Trametes elegans]|nr:hypothetical protein BD413DRAFT_220572 [Trametes elegans]